MYSKQHKVIDQLSVPSEPFLSSRINTMLAGNEWLRNGDTDPRFVTLTCVSESVLQ